MLPSLNGDAPLPTTAGIASALEPAITDPRLGPRVLAAVVDPLTGTLLYGREESATAIPASTAKIVTGAAVLAELVRTRGHDRVVRGLAHDEIVLVARRSLLTAVPASAANDVPTPTRLTAWPPDRITLQRRRGGRKAARRSSCSRSALHGVEGNSGGAVSPLPPHVDAHGRGGAARWTRRRRGNVFAAMRGQQACGDGTVSARWRPRRPR